MPGKSDAMAGVQIFKFRRLTMAKAKIRNPYVAQALLRKAGRHGKSNSAIRVERKREAEKIVERCISQSHYLAD